MNKVTKQQRLATIDLVVPRDNPAILNAMFSVIASRPWAIDFVIAIDEALANGDFALMDDDEDLDY